MQCTIWAPGHQHPVCVHTRSDVSMNCCCLVLCAVDGECWVVISVHVQCRYSARELSPCVCACSVCVSGLNLLFGPCRMCVHLYTCVYISTYVCTSLHMCVHLYTFVYIYTHVCTSLHMCVHLYTCVYISTHVCTSLHMCVHLYTCVYISTHVCLSIHMCV